MFLIESSAAVLFHIHGIVGEGGGECPRNGVLGVCGRVLGPVEKVADFWVCKKKKKKKKGREAGLEKIEQEGETKTVSSSTILHYSR